MRKAKNRNNDQSVDTKKSMEQRCELCRGTDIALAGMMIRGKVKWVCYNCYKKG